VTFGIITADEFGSSRQRRNGMKKLLRLTAMAVGLTLAVGSVSAAFAQEKKDDNGGKKKGKKKKKEEKKDQR
jgi:hypothetical protein